MPGWGAPASGQMDLRESSTRKSSSTTTSGRAISRCPIRATARPEGYNPLCGDKITVYLYVEGDVIKDLGFQGTGCAISKASASLMTDALKGKTLAQANALFDQFHGMVTAPASASGRGTDSLGKLAVLSACANIPMRVKCASLAWHTLKAAMQAEHDVVSTE